MTNQITMSAISFVNTIMNYKNGKPLPIDIENTLFNSTNFRDNITIETESKAINKNDKNSGIVSVTIIHLADKICYLDSINFDSNNKSSYITTIMVVREYGEIVSICIDLENGRSIEYRNKNSPVTVNFGEIPSDLYAKPIIVQLTSDQLYTILNTDIDKLPSTIKSTLNRAGITSINTKTCGIYNKDNRFSITSLIEFSSDLFNYIEVAYDNYKVMLRVTNIPNKHTVINKNIPIKVITEYAEIEGIWEETGFGLT